jgi:hypothetical protein
VESAEIKAAKASTGQVTFSGRQFMTADMVARDATFEFLDRKTTVSHYICCCGCLQFALPISRSKA